MSFTKRIVIILAIIILPSLIILPMIRIQDNRDLSDTFKYGTNWKLRQATGLTKDNLAPDCAEAIIEVNAGRTIVCIRTADKNRGLAAINDVRHLLSTSLYKSNSSTHKGIVNEFFYITGKSSAYTRIHNTSNLVHISSIAKTIRKHYKSAVILLRVPYYADIDFTKVNLSPVYTKRTYKWYKLDNTSADNAVKVSASIKSTMDNWWIISVAAALLICTLGNIAGVCLTGITTSPAADRKTLMKYASSTPAYLGAFALLILAGFALFGGQGLSAIDLMVVSISPITVLKTVIPGLLINFFFSFLIIQIFVSIAFDREAVLQDSSLSNSEKFKQLTDKLNPSYLLLFAFGMMILLVSNSDLLHLYLSVYFTPFLALTIFYSILREERITSQLRIELGLVDTKWLSEIENLLNKYTERISGKKINVDLGEKSMKTGYVKDSLFGPLNISGKTATDLSIKELEFILLDKVLYPIKYIGGIWHIMLFYFIGFCCLTILRTTGMDSQILVDTYWPYLLASIVLPILVALFQLPATIGSPLPSVKRYRKILSTTGDYYSARSALVKFNAYTTKGKSNRSRISRLITRYKLNILRIASRSNSRDIV